MTVDETVDQRTDETVDEFLQRAHAHLRTNVPRATASESRWGHGSDAIGVIEEPHPDRELEILTAARRWRAGAFDAGIVWPDGPRAYGGGGMPPETAAALRTLCQQYEVPDQSVFAVGLGMVAPAILHHGTEDLRRQFLPALFRGDQIGCQLFSEPEAGSDLASVKTHARRDGDEWVVDGQKVWTSNGHLADVGELLVRTDPSASKHAGLTMFLVDMDSPGVEVRPIRQMTGGASFNEVFLNGVRIPDERRLGQPGDGWKVALTTLMSERAEVGDGRSTADADAVRRVTELAGVFGRLDDPTVRQDLAAIHSLERVGKWYVGLCEARLAPDEQLGPEMSVSKLLYVERLQRISSLVSRLLGPSLTADTGAWGTYAWADYVLGVPGLRIAGGTDEIMRNIISERVLGLPREPRSRSSSP